MSSIPVALHASSYVTMDETAVRLDVTRPTVRQYIHDGLLTASTIGRTKLVNAASLQRLLDLGTDVVRAQLFHAANERASNNHVTPEIEAREASEVARHRAAIAKAKLRLVREKDLDALQPTEPPHANTMGEVFPDITDRSILKFVSTAAGISSEPLHRWTDDQLRELLRLARMAEGRSRSSIQQ